MSILPNDSVLVVLEERSVHVDAELSRVRVRERQPGRELGGRTLAAYPFEQVEQIEIEYLAPFSFALGLRLDSGKTLDFGTTATRAQATFIADAVQSVVGCHIVEILPDRPIVDRDDEPTVHLIIRN